MSEQLEIVIACIPNAEGTFRRTVPGIGAAALYADRVTVVTREADTLAEMAQTEGSEIVHEEWFTNVYSDNEDDWDDVGYTWDAIHRRHSELVEQGRSDEFENDPITEELFERLELEEIQAVIRLSERMITTPNSLPMIHDPEGELNRLAVDLGSLGHMTKRRARAVANVGTGLTARLPGFDSLSIPEIIQLREELSSSLAPFRSYIVETGAGLYEVGDDRDAWLDVVNEIYLGKTLPALAELQQEMVENQFLQSIIRDFRQNPQALLGSFLTLGIGHFAEIPLPATIGGAVGLDAIARIARIRHTKKKLKNDKLHFLYGLGRAIESQERGT